MADGTETSCSCDTLPCTCTPFKQSTEPKVFLHRGIEDVTPDDDSTEDLKGNLRDKIAPSPDLVTEEWWTPSTISELHSFAIANEDPKDNHAERLESKGAVGGFVNPGSEELIRKLGETEVKSEDILPAKTIELHGDQRSETEFRHRYTTDRPSVLETEFKTLQSSDECKKQRNNGAAKTKTYEKDSANNTESVSSNEAVSKEKVDSSTEKLSFMKYFTAEVFRGKFMELEEDKYTERREKVYIFMTIPREFEKLMVFGFMLCLDCFLFMFTFLPLRVIVALYKIVTGLLLCRTTRMLQPAQICDLLKGSILLACWLLLTYVDFAVLYHTVRGQSVIKLYVIYNMLEIADRLFSSFGQDILDALFWTATEPKDRRREHIGIIPHFAMAVAYVFFHAILVLFQAICLNVAVNSHNKALLVIMVSNQFVELKGSVFKRFEKNNLFQMACSDIRERFHYIVLISIVTLRNLTEFNWNFGHLYVISPYLLAVLSSEYFVDWIKHAFITKFNNIPVEVYCEYRALLAEDATSSRQKNAHADHFDLVSRRMGFIPLPLGSLLIKVISQSVKLHGLAGVCLLLTAFVCLTSVKVLNSIIFLGKASQYVHEKQQQESANARKGNQASALNLRAQASATLLDSVHSSTVSLSGERRRTQGQDGQTKRRAKTLAEIDRYTLCSKEIVVF